MKKSQKINLVTHLVVLEVLYNPTTYWQCHSMDGANRRYKEELNKFKIVNSYKIPPKGHRLSLISLPYVYEDTKDGWAVNEWKYLLQNSWVIKMTCGVDFPHTVELNAYGYEHLKTQSTAMSHTYVEV